MRSKIATYALAGALGLTGVVGAALVAPAVASAATGDTTALADRVSSLKDALKGLVSDGSLTQAQADEVAETLAEARPEGLRGWHGGRGGGPGGGLQLDAAAEALGLTVDELRTAAEQGSSLADLAEQEGVSTDALVADLVAAAKTRLADAVADGRLTQAEADERVADVQTRITERLDEPLRLGRGGHGGPGGHGHGPGADDETEADGTAPSTPPSTPPSTAPSTAPSEDPDA